MLNKDILNHIVTWFASDVHVGVLVGRVWWLRLCLWQAGGWAGAVSVERGETQHHLAQGSPSQWEEMERWRD